MIKYLRFVVLIFSLFFLFFSNIHKLPTNFTNSARAADVEPLVNDFILPNKDRDIGGETKILKAPLGAGEYDMAEYMMGKVSISIILPESDGSLNSSTEDWTAAQEAVVKDKIKSAMNWYKQYKSKANLSFKYHFYSGRTNSKARTKYEPIDNISPSSTLDGIWVAEIMKNFGYSKSSYFLDNVRDFADAKRKKDKTDWSYVFFVVNDINDGTGRFKDNNRAHAFLGGPYALMTYTNGGYTVNNMNYVAAHETGHIFYATDEYDNIISKSGYLGIYDNDGAGGMMEVGNTWWLSNSSQQQLGWRDKNNNGIFDILDLKPTLSINNKYSLISDARPYFGGYAQVKAYKNKNPYYGTYHPKIRHNISIDKISSVKYKTDNGKWTSVKTKSSSNGGKKTFSLRLKKLKEGWHKISMETRNGVGNLTQRINFNRFKIMKGLVVTGTDLGASPQVAIFKDNGSIKKRFFAFDGNNLFGVNVAAGDVDGDGSLEIVASEGEGGLPEVRIFDTSGNQKHSFNVDSYSNNNGVFVAACDVDGKGIDRIVTFSEGENVNIFDKNGKKLSSFEAGTAANLACGDVNADGKEEIVIGASSGLLPVVKIFDKSGTSINRFLALEESYLGGVNVAAGDLDDNGKAEIIVAVNGGMAPYVFVFDELGNKKIMPGFLAFDESFRGGVRVGAADFNLDGKAEIVAGAGNDMEPKVKIFEGDGTVYNNGFNAYDASLRTGIFVVGAP